MSPAENSATPTNPFASEPGDVTEDTGVGFMTVNTTQTTPPLSQVLYSTGGDAPHEIAASSGTDKSNLSPGALLIATRDFSARNPDELSFTKGDRIVLIERDEKYNDGWFLGQLVSTRRIGIFPQCEHSLSSNPIIEWSTDNG